MQTKMREEGVCKDPAKLLPLRMWTAPSPFAQQMWCSSPHLLRDNLTSKINLIHVWP